MQTFIPVMHLQNEVTDCSSYKPEEKLQKKKNLKIETR